MPSSTKYFRDAFIGFPGGMNSGVAPSLLERDQVAIAVNTTFRGGYATTRPALRKLELEFLGDDATEALFEEGRFQGGDFYQSDDGTGMIIGAIGGRLFRILPGYDTATVQDVSINNFTTVTAMFVVPAVGAVVNILVASTALLPVGSTITIGTGSYVIVSITGPTSLTVQNVDDSSATVAAGTILQAFDLNPASRPQVWMQQAEKWLIVQDGQSVPIIFDGASSRRSNVVGAVPEISAGKMMAYWLGRLWWVNPDGLSFRAGDLVYSSSGSSSQKLRDSVLKQTQNSFIADGGNFTVPANAGPITMMQAVAVLDASLGQGPLQVGTAKMTFGCTASTDNTEWQNTNSPILGVSLIENGSLSQWASVLANGDLFYRAPDGIRTLVLGRREFNVWGNVPASREMNAILETDQQDLLNYASAIVFDNRMLMTSGPIPSPRGTYHRGIIALDFDVVSSMRGKLPPVYDGVWTGLRTLKLVKGRFAGTERAFAFTQTVGGTIEFFEILPTGAATTDDDNAIIWQFQTGDAFRDSGLRAGQKIRLHDGELFVDEIAGFVSFQVFFRPDQASCWIPWNRWSVCAQTCQRPESPYECMEDPYPVPQFKNRMGFGMPPGTCNPDTNSPYREGWTFQIKIIVTGSCRIKGIRLKGVEVDEPECAPPMCQDQCYNQETFDSYEQQICCGDVLETLTNVSATLPTGVTLVGNCLVMAAGTYTSTVSKAVATQLAWNALNQFFRANIESGALLCSGITWFCGGTLILEPIDPDCSNALPGMILEGTEVDFNPDFESIGTSKPCSGETTLEYVAEPNSTAVIGPFTTNKKLNLGGNYHIKYDYYELGFCTGFGTVGVRAYTQVLGDSQEFLIVQDGPPSFDLSGSWATEITIPSGNQCIIELSSSVIAETNPDGSQVPIAQISITSFVLADA